MTRRSNKVHLSRPARPDTPTSRRQRRSAETREKLFRAALDLFATKGFLETTVEDITEAADVGKGTFFNYFPSKDHILLAFGEMQIGKLEASVDAVREASEPMTVFLQNLVNQMTQDPMRNPALIRAILQAFLSTTSVRAAMMDMQRRVLGFHTEMFKIGQERGEIRSDLPASDIAQVFRQTIFGTLLIWSLYGDATLQARLDAAFNVLWSGLTPRGAEAPGYPSPSAIPGA